MNDIVKTETTGFQYVLLKKDSIVEVYGCVKGGMSISRVFAETEKEERAIDDNP